MLKLMEIRMESGQCTGSEIRFDHRIRCRISSLFDALKKLYSTPETQKKVLDVFSWMLSKETAETRTFQGSLSVAVLKDQYGVILEHHLTP